MRIALRPNPKRQPVSKAITLPAPVAGWDAVSPIANMKPDRALVLDNWFPQPGTVDLRRGSLNHANTGTAAAVDSIMAYHGLTGGKLFAASGATIFDVTVANEPSTALTGLQNARWQHVNFATSGGHFLWACNGADDPITYNGATWAATSISVIDPTAIIGVTAYKGRLWLVRTGSIDAAYLPADSIQGAATNFPLGALFTKGGVLMAIGTWSLDGGDGPDDYIAFVSSRGQIAIYGGVDPTDASDFMLKGVYDISPPIGRRCLTKVGPDLAVITLDGILPLSRALITERGASLTIALTQRIQPVMATSARDYGANYGWQLTSYPRGTMAILNVPIQEGIEQHQYVMNTVTGAWCRFLGWNANCFEVFQDKLYFGSNDGYVIEADTGSSDNDQPITADLRTAFNYFGARGRLKSFKMARGIFTTDTTVSPNMALNIDFEEDAPLSALATVGTGAALWDVALWDVATWAEARRVTSSWFSAGGVGYAASLRVRIELTTGDLGETLWDSMVWDVDAWDFNAVPQAILQINSFDLIAEPGGVM